MIILVVNAGSSSLKYQLIDMSDESVIAKGNCDRIGIDGHINHKTADGRVLLTLRVQPGARHDAVALQKAMQKLSTAWTLFPLSDTE